MVWFNAGLLFGLVLIVGLCLSVRLVLIVWVYLFLNVVCAVDLLLFIVVNGCLVWTGCGCAGLPGVCGLLLV